MGFVQYQLFINRNVLDSHGDLLCVFHWHPASRQAPPKAGAVGKVFFLYLLSGTPCTADAAEVFIVNFLTRLEDQL